MKCSRCGHRTRTLVAMSAHCRKKHPRAMKPKNKEHRPRVSKEVAHDKLDRLEKILELIG